MLLIIGCSKEESDQKNASLADAFSSQSFSSVKEIKSAGRAAGSSQKGDLRCGSTIIMASFSDITSWQNWSPTLAKMYFEVSRSIPSAREEEGIHRFMASGSLC